MPSMVSYSHRLQSGHITCYLDRTFDVLLTPQAYRVDSFHPTTHPVPIVVPRACRNRGLDGRVGSSQAACMRFATFLRKSSRVGPLLLPHRAGSQSPRPHQAWPACHAKGASLAGTV